MAIHYITGSAANNDKGVTINGGTISGSRMSARGLGETAEIGTAVLRSTDAHLHSALGSGTFAEMTKGKYVIKRVTTELATVANTALLSGGSDHAGRKSINFAETFAQTFLNGLSWSADIDGQPVYTFDIDTATANIGTDDCARDNRAAPGELTYGLGQGPQNATYAAKHG